MQIGYEHFVINLYKHNLALALPLTILGIKMVVRTVAREPAKDIFRSILTMPLDFVYIAIGLLLTGIARRLPNFAAHYQSDKEADFAGAILLLGLIFGAVVITWLDRRLRLFWQKFYAAWNLVKTSKQMTLPGQENVVSRTTAMTLMWMTLYWAIMIPILFAEILIALKALGSIVRLL
jgi:hypothetical protein